MHIQYCIVIHKEYNSRFCDEISYFIIQVGTDLKIGTGTGTQTGTDTE